MISSCLLCLPPRGRVKSQLSVASQTLDCSSHERKNPMKRIYCSLTLLLISAVAVSGQSKRNPLEGSWQAIEVVHPVLEIGSIATVVDVTTAPGAELQVTNATVGTTLSGQSL